jgi:outer membrane lipoprotein SlyB
MDELIKQVTERTGISDEQARTAVNTVVGFLKERLPAPIAGQVDNVIGGSAGAVGGIADKAGDMLGGIGGMFGKKE